MTLGESNLTPAPVLALTVVDATTLKDNEITSESKVLCVVRAPETNLTHPNVVSTPTQRIPAALYQGIVDSTARESNILNYSSMTSVFCLNKAPCSHDPILYAVEGILSKKLGVGEYLESKQIVLRARLGLIEFGRTFYPTNSGNETVPHYIVMINIMVFIYEGINFFPDKTTSYSHFFWVEVSRYFEMIKYKDPTQISQNLNPFKFCVKGMCISTTNTILRMALNLKSK